MRRKGISILLIFMFIVAIFYNGRQVRSTRCLCLVPLRRCVNVPSASKWEATARLDFLWRLQAQQEVEDMRELREHNECLLYNILPVHVARHFLDRSKNDEVKRNLCWPFSTFTLIKVHRCDLPSLNVSGALLPVLRWGRCHVCFHRWLQWILWADGDQTRGRRVPPAAERDHRRLRRGDRATHDVGPCSNPRL